MHFRTKESNLDNNIHQKDISSESSIKIHYPSIPESNMLKSSQNSQKSSSNPPQLLTAPNPSILNNKAQPWYPSDLANNPESSIPVNPSSLNPNNTSIPSASIHHIHQALASSNTEQHQHIPQPQVKVQTSNTKSANKVPN